MKRHRNWFLLVVFYGSFVSAKNPLECTRQAYSDRSLHELNFLARHLNRNQLGEFGNSREAFVILNHPHAAGSIQYGFCSAWALSTAACGIDLQDNPGTDINEETDAIRHFIASARITCLAGKRIAELVMAAHEGPPSMWDADNLMDIRNNYVAFNWAENPENCKNATSDQAIVKAALEHLKKGKLETLTKGTTRCASDSIHTIEPKKLIEKSKEIRDRIRTIIPQRCGGTQ